MKELTTEKNKTGNSCLSCGTFANMKNRRYCSVSCRQKLRQTLNRRTGLLKALNARYASFYFTESMIIMDVLPYGSSELFSFLFPRQHKKKPCDDFSQMANILGDLWWSEKKRSNKSYIASQQVLRQARRDNGRLDSVKPIVLETPTVKGASILHLKLGKSDLETRNYKEIIKKTYRKQAKKHHPDLGGDSAIFRKIHKAYEELLDWSESPTFIKRKGFPDKWFYCGEQNRWVQPIPLA